LGERFHLGGYLFWIGWILISAYYLSKKREVANVKATPLQYGGNSSEATFNK
jgi:hypothetical protein